jgi:cellulose synthase/poly-beta-1,6-N-acetylglucosamine synthase-like glycosyltransferase
MIEMLDIVLILIFLSLSLLYASWILIYLIPSDKANNDYSPDMSIILPAHNEEGVIENTIKSIFNAEYLSKKEVIVVNDGSTDKTGKIVKGLTKKYPQLKLFNVKHQGKAASLNFGMSKAKYNTLVLLDADSYLEKDTLKELVKPLSDKNIAAVSGVIRARITKNPLTWYQDFEYMMTSGWRYACHKINSVSVLPGFMAIKKKTLKKIGGFSTDTLTEDFDVALNLRKADFDIVMSTKAVIKTTVPDSLSKLFSQRFRWGRGTLQVVKKHSNMLFSKRFGLLGSYTFPTHIFWYIFSLSYIPSVIYWMFREYYIYFFSQNNIISLSSLEYFFKWFTAYGMFDLIYQTYTGMYEFNLVLLFTITSFILTNIYTFLVFLKVTKPDWRHLFVFFFLFPYNVLIIFVQSLSWIYEFINKTSSSKWEKNE